jgi:hypothetical protein
LALEVLDGVLQPCDDAVNLGQKGFGEDGDAHGPIVQKQQ